MPEKKCGPGAGATAHEAIETNQSPEWKISMSNLSAQLEWKKEARRSRDRTVEFAVLLEGFGPAPLWADPESFNRASPPCASAYRSAAVEIPLINEPGWSDTEPATIALRIRHQIAATQPVIEFFTRRPETAHAPIPLSVDEAAELAYQLSLAVRAAREGGTAQ